MSTPLDSASQPNLHLHLGRNYGMRPFTRHITGHDAAGKSKFLPSPHVLYLDRGGYEITRSFAVGSVPAQLTDDQDVRSYLSSDGKTEACSYANAGAQILVPNGLNFLTVDFGPSSSTAMHRTVTIDFVTVVQGQLVLELDGGEKKLLKAGDTIVQRETMHRWINPSEDRPARMVCVTAASLPVTVGGNSVEQVFLPREETADAGSEKHETTA